jgi:hypothetical protein
VFRGADDDDRYLRSLCGGLACCGLAKGVVAFWLAKKRQQRVGFEGCPKAEAVQLKHLTLFSPTGTFLGPEVLTSSVIHLPLAIPCQRSAAEHTSHF